MRSLVGAVVLLLMLAGLWLTSPALPGVAVSADAPDLPSDARQMMQGRIVAAELAPPDPFNDARPGTVFTVHIGDGALAGREALRTVRGCLGLAAAMPLTTWLACGMCSPRPRRPRRRVYRPAALDPDNPAEPNGPDGPYRAAGPEATG